MVEKTCSWPPENKRVLSRLKHLRTVPPGPCLLVDADELALLSASYRFNCNPLARQSRMRHWRPNVLQGVLELYALDHCQAGRIFLPCALLCLCCTSDISSPTTRGIMPIHAGIFKS